MPDTQIQGLPQGAIVGPPIQAQSQPPSNGSVEGLPPGAIVGPSFGGQDTPDDNPPLDFAHTVARGGQRLLSGIGGGVIGTLDTIGSAMLPDKLLKSVGVSQQALDTSNKNVQQLTEQRNTGEKVGGGLENIMEFLAGDEALKSLSLADKLGLATKVAKIAETPEIS